MQHTFFGVLLTDYVIFIVSNDLHEYNLYFKRGVVVVSPQIPL